MYQSQEFFCGKVTMDIFWSVGLFVSWKARGLGELGVKDEHESVHAVQNGTGLWQPIVEADYIK